MLQVPTSLENAIFGACNNLATADTNTQNQNNMSRKSLLPLGIVALLIAGSCAKKDAEEMKSGVILTNMDTLVKPGDDFAAFVNGAWIKRTEIPADKTSYGVWEMLQDKAQEDVKAIIEESAKGDFKKGSNEQKIGDLYDSYLDTKTRDSKGIEPLKPVFERIDAIKSTADLGAYMGWANRNGYTTPMAINVIEDFKDPTRYILYTWQGGIGLPDREYYFLSDEKSNALRDAYVKHMAKMMEIAGIADANAKSGRIMALETAIAAKHMKKEDTRNIAGLYNIYAVADLGQLAPSLDWKAFLDNAKIKGQDSLMVPQVEYTRALNGIITSTPVDTWKDYLKWAALNDAASQLSMALDKQNFEFYGKALYGQQEQRPMWRRGVDLVNNNLGEIVGEVYVKKHFSPEAKKRMGTMVDNLLKAYEESIKTLDWMTEDTKKEALNKLKKFTPKIGYPDKWRDYSGLEIEKGDLFGNLHRSRIFEYDRQLGKLGKPVDRDEWMMTPQTVNAYYNPTLNEIVFPAAILQPPYFDLDAEDAVNYGGIGAVIGHEIGHGFDDQGSTFDGDGVMREWWTQQDRDAFKARTGALVNQYNEFKVFPDLNVNGAFTLGENIGDLGGLSIAYKAYKLSLNGKQSPILDGFSGEQRVFIGWAQAWLSKEREESLRNQVASDPHSPALFRINGTIRNIPEFYEAFDVKPGDALYLAPEKRVKIW